MRCLRKLVTIVLPALLIAGVFLPTPAHAGVLAGEFTGTFNLSPGISLTPLTPGANSYYSNDIVFVAAGDINGVMNCGFTGTAPSETFEEGVVSGTLSCTGGLERNASDWFSAAIGFVRTAGAAKVMGTIVASGTAGIVGAVILGVVLIVAAAVVANKIIEMRAAGKAAAAK